VSSAIERLAAELLNLPAEQWARLAELRIVSQEQGAAFGPAWDEFSERLAPREPAADQAHNEAGAPPQATVRSRNQT